MGSYGFGTTIVKGSYNQVVLAYSTTSRVSWSCSLHFNGSPFKIGVLYRLLILMLFMSILRLRTRIKDSDGNSEGTGAKRKLRLNAGGKGLPRLSDSIFARI